MEQTMNEQPKGIYQAMAAIAAEIRSAVFTLLAGLQALDGQIDFSIFVANDHDLYVLPFRQVLPDVTDVGIGDFGNMYHAGLVLRQGNESAKIGDGLDFPL